MNPTATHEYAATTDTAIAAAWDRVNDAQRARLSTIDALHYAAKDKRDYSRNKSNPLWKLSFDETLAVLTTVKRQPWETSINDLLAKFEDAEALWQTCRDECAALEKLYTGWARFFIVPGGHIHSSRRCSTCYPTTMFGWLPALSGLTEADAVAEHGPLLCSVCYPLAPVEWTVGPEKKTYCSGTGKSAGSHGRYAPCPDCGKYVAVTTSSGAIRAHQPA